MKSFPHKFFKKDFILGLDIGSSAIKLAQFLNQEGGLHLLSIKLTEITKDKKPLSALREIISGMDIKNSKVITLVNSPHAMAKRIVVPQMPHAELREAITLEAKNYFPFPVSDSLMDFEILGEVLEKEIKKLALLVAICPKQVVSEHLDLLNAAGISPSQVLYPGLALYNLLKLKTRKEDANIAALDIGRNYCELVIVRDGKPALNRKIPVAGDDFTQALTGGLVSDLGKVQLSLEEAEKIKIEYGIPGVAGQEIIENKITAGQLLSLLRVPSEKLSAEIARSFDFFREETQGGRVDKLLLLGGASRLKGLDKFLAEQMGIEVEIYDSLEGINLKPGLITKDLEITRIACAVGAGINAAEGINLLPPEIRDEMKKMVEKASLKAVSSALVTLLVLVFTGMRIQLSALDKKIASSRFALSVFERQFRDAPDQLLITAVLKDQPYCEDALREISNVVPADICLKEINIERQLFTVKGTILTSEKPEEVVSRFIQPLEKGLFKNVRFSTTGKKAGAKEFQLEMEME